MSVVINSKVVIPESELEFSFSKSSGPGGQNVNKVETRVTLSFSVDSSPSLTARQKRLIKQKLRSRINQNGILQITSQEHRTQADNRREATEKFARLLSEALKPKRSRIKTRIPVSQKRKRLEDKKRRSETKKMRKPVD